ncbi:MAG TPA: endolytic transglycosylase MltG [Rhizomicrobium sp.]
MARFFGLILILIVIGAGAFFAEKFSFLRPGPSTHETVVLIAPREGSAGIAQELQRADVIRNGFLFRFGVRLRNRQSALKAGEYAIPAGASMADIMGILVEGKSIQHKITAAEGLTSQMIYDIVVHDPVLVGDAGAVPSEGALLPETYLFTRGATRAEILARMEAAQKTFLALHWPARAPDLPLKTKAQVITLASIVEKETALPEERRHIAAVFVNRLNLGMKLQSDPTIIYGITKGYPLGRRIRESEITANTPYNTYVIAGLPAGPICNPGKDSISAVLNPEQSKDLYFVANGKGGHVFSATMAQHEQNVAAWRKIHDTHPPPRDTPRLRKER